MAQCSLGGLFVCLVVCLFVGITNCRVVLKHYLICIVVLSSQHLAPEGRVCLLPVTLSTAVFFGDIRLFVSRRLNFNEVVGNETLDKRCCAQVEMDYLVGILCGADLCHAPQSKVLVPNDDGTKA